MNERQFQAWLVQQAPTTVPRSLRDQVGAITTEVAPSDGRVRPGGRRLALVGLLAAALTGSVLAVGATLMRPAEVPGNGVIVVVADSAMAFDPRSGRLLARDEPVVAGGSVPVAALDGAEQAAWAPDGRSMALSTGGHIEILDMISGDRRSILRVPSCDSFGCDLAWSPDGTRLVVAAPGAIQVVDLGTSAVSTIAQLDGTPTVSWSPDGAWIAVGAQSFLYRVRPDGTSLTTLLREGEAQGDGVERIGPLDVTWAPDGTRIGYMSSDAFTPDEGWHLTIVSVAPDGTDRQEIVDAGACHCLGWGPPGFTWSPDGKQVAFVTLGYIPPHRARDPRTPANGGLYVASVDGSGRHRLVGERDGTVLAGSPAWQPVP